MKKIIKKIKRIYIKTVETKPGAIGIITVIMTIALISIIELLNLLFKYKPINEFIPALFIVIPLTIYKNKEKIKKIIKFWKYFCYMFKVYYLVNTMKTIFVLLVLWLFRDIIADSSIKNYFKNALNFILIIFQIIIGLLVFGASYKGFYSIRSRLIFGHLEFSCDEKEYFEEVLNKCIDKYGVLKIKENALLVDALIKWNYGTKNTFENYKIPDKTQIAEEKFYNLSPLQRSKYRSYIFSGNEKYRSKVEYLLREEDIYKFSMKKDKNGKIIICRWSYEDEECN